MRLAALAAGAVLALAGCGGGTKSSTPTDAKTLFQQQCATCHTLADAGSNSTYAVNLDTLKPTKARVLRAIEEGPGTMEADLLAPREAELVAAYVARVTRAP